MNPETNDQPDYGPDATTPEQRRAFMLIILVILLMISGVWYLSEHMGTLVDTFAPAATLAASQSNNTYTGTLPTDICKIDGKPQILHAAAESVMGFEGFVFTYVRTDGYIVSQLWRKANMTQPYQTYIIEAAMCPKAGVQ